MSDGLIAWVLAAGMALLSSACGAPQCPAEPLSSRGYALTTEDVEAAMQAADPEVHACRDGGEVQVGFRVEPSGALVDVHLIRGGLSQAEQQCVLDAVRQQQLPPSDGTGGNFLSYLFQWTPKAELERRAESIALEKQRIEHFDALFSAEGRDEPWATGAENLATTALEAVGAAIISVECRNTFCRMEFALPPTTMDIDPLRQLMMAPEPTGSPFEQNCSSIGPKSGIFEHWTMFCARGDHVLPI